MTTQICVTCQGDDDAMNVAAIREMAWDRSPIEVKEYQCDDCGYTKHWWWFEQTNDDTERALRRAFLTLTWEPGDLTTTEIERVLTDALADLWRDSFRQGNPAAQRKIFGERVRNAIKCATGDRGVF